MTTAAKKILADALALPEDERAALVEELANSFVGAEIDEPWRAEILRRVEQVRNGEVTLESWEAVRQAGRDALAQR